jgi:hypothetical protein
LTFPLSNDVFIQNITLNVGEIAAWRLVFVVFYTSLWNFIYYLLLQTSHCHLSCHVVRQNVPSVLSGSEINLQYQESLIELLS